MPQRINLDDAVSQSRSPIDANWSPRKKTIIGGGSALIAILAITGGAWVALAQRPPSMPTSAEDALAVMGSSAYDRMDEERKRQYAAEARRLLGTLSEEERRALIGDKENRALLWDMRQQLADEMARRIARGEEVQWPPQGARPSQAQREARRAQWENMIEEERAAMRNELIAQARDRTAEAAESGNGQSGSLIQEMRRSGAGRRGGGGGGRGGR